MLQNATKELRRWRNISQTIYRTHGSAPRRLNAGSAAINAQIPLGEGQHLERSDEIEFMNKFCSRKGSSPETSNRTIDDTLSKIFDCDTPLATTTQAQSEEKKQTKLSIPKAVPFFMRNSASFLLHKALGHDADKSHWREQIAVSRSRRPDILLLQMVLRQEESRLSRVSALEELLPSQTQLNSVLNGLSKFHRSTQPVHDSYYVLSGSTDDEKCERLIELGPRVPWHIVLFVIRTSAKIESISTLHSLIKASCSFCNVIYGQKLFESVSKPSPARKTKFSVPKNLPLEESKRIDNNRFLAVLGLLAYRCGRVDPRLIVELSRVAADFIANLAAHGSETRRLHNQYMLFNRLLDLFQPPSEVLPIHNLAPNAYFWEAQRIQLAASSSLEKPLLINLAGFRALRVVLTGQEKNQTEQHSSTRHAPTWPPYLQDADGIDEGTDPVDSWSRAVRAGMLMQEAGFAKQDEDYALDMLQGMSLDGSPTIQQRSLLRNRQVGIWEASIKATRSIEEAWQRFQNPPVAGTKPGLREYAAIFEKMVAREAGSQDEVLPGDKALTFAPYHEANLTDFERARRKCPSLRQLYDQMRLQGLEPSGLSLRILVAHAQDLDTAHQYLRDSTEGRQALDYLLSDNMEDKNFERISSSLFAAYVQVAVQADDCHSGKRVMRLLYLASMRQKESCRWTAKTWRIILKELSRGSAGLGISIPQQLELLQRVAQRVEYYSGPMVSTLIQFSKCIRKVLRRKLKWLESNWKVVDWAVEERWLPLSQKRTESRDQDMDMANMALREAVDHMQAMFERLVEREEQIGKIVRPHDMKVLDYMVSRTDAVRSEHAHEYLMTLAFVGKFEEMAQVLLWLVKQWTDDKVAQALNSLDQIPSYADFSETLCGFRLLAEPMLEQHVVESVQRAALSAGVGWGWPDDETVLAWADSHQDDYITTLKDVLDLMDR
ncbi:hypothetical protein CDD81_4530 [Ophiocordyceps australis]|uniref:Uncharacterized protein n=1 Tax=Ophiocordyceps australis TaxID=1399860 RepID=A0A2C5Y4N1_9HYPO|nr:hypothetical protein CDD81_4530 [Ophiocordyceps australis]